MSQSSPAPEHRWSIGKAAERTGLSVHTLRFYEREGLFAFPVERDRSGHRLYSDWDLEWLEVCSKLRTSGMPLTVIRHYAELVGQGDGTEHKRLELLRDHQDRLRAEIATLIDCLALVSFKIGIYETRRPESSDDPLITPRPRAATQAPRCRH